jgi:helicase
MYKAMKIKNLKNYGIPSYILNIWEKHYSPYLLPLQEDAVRKYGVLDYGEGSDEIAALSSKARNDREIDSRFRGCVVTNSNRAIIFCKLKKLRFLKLIYK